MGAKSILRVSRMATLSAKSGCGPSIGGFCRRLRPAQCKHARFDLGL
jgi:hypothetical protein